MLHFSELYNWSAFSYYCFVWILIIFIFSVKKKHSWVVDNIDNTYVVQIKYVELCDFAWLSQHNFEKSIKNHLRINFTKHLKILKLVDLGLQKHKTDRNQQIATANYSKYFRRTSFLQKTFMFSLVLMVWISWNICKYLSWRPN